MKKSVLIFSPSCGVDINQLREVLGSVGEMMVLVEEALTETHLLNDNREVIWEVTLKQPNVLGCRLYIVTRGGQTVLKGLDLHNGLSMDDNHRVILANIGFDIVDGKVAIGTKTKRLGTRAFQTLADIQSALKKQLAAQ